MDDEPLAGKVFDTGFRFKDPTTSDDLHRSLLHDPESRVTLVLWQDRSFPCLQIYTPGIHAPIPSQSIYDTDVDL
jgi:hypothetical protein